MRREFILDFLFAKAVRKITEKFKTGNFHKIEWFSSKCKVSWQVFITVSQLRTLTYQKLNLFSENSVFEILFISQQDAKSFDEFICRGKKISQNGPKCMSDFEKISIFRLTLSAHIFIFPLGILQLTRRNHSCYKYQAEWLVQKFSYKSCAVEKREESMKLNGIIELSSGNR